jgi:FkbM family methyltransferase
MKSWWLDELAYAGQEHLDPSYVAGYDRKAGFDPTEDVEALRAFGLDRNSVVIDLGAGTGTFTVAVAEHCRRVIAVDVSPPMIAALQRRVTEIGIDNVTVVRGGFLSYQHEAEPADFVYTRHALHQIPDFWKSIALARTASMLRPGGILRLRDLIFDFQPAEAEAWLDAWLAGAVSDPAVGWTAAELAEHVRIEFSTYRWLLEPMLDRAGFDVMASRFVRSVYGVYDCRRRDPTIRQRGV